MEKSMRDNILEKIDEIVSMIQNSEKYIRYIEVSNKMKENKELLEKIDAIKEMQQQLVKEEAKGNNIEEIDKKLKEKLKELEEVPLYIEYTYLQEDLNDSISLVREKIENYINEITN